MFRKCCTFLLLAFGCSVSAIEITGIPNSHDPAAIIKDGGTYFHFTTGDGIWYSRSTNLTHWGNPATVFPVGTWPEWIDDAVPGFGGHFWAPDVIYMNDYYYLYYSVSTFGSSRSAIGVVRTPSLNSPDWEDLGMVVSSDGSSTAINAIDPAIFRDEDGQVYMSYGSWFGGIGVIEIDSETGLAQGELTHIYGGNHQGIEAPYITRDGDYYYLYVNRGTCCQGLNSGYYIEVGRATDIRGPYTGWRTLLPNREGRYHGPGHIGLLEEDSCRYVSIHYYDVEAGGTAKLDILSLHYINGWPVLTREFSIGNCPAPAVDEAQLVARYAFEDNLADSFGEFAEGVVIGDDIEQAEGGSISYTAGAWPGSRAAAFDGFSGVRLPDSLIDSNSYSVAFWLHPDQLSQHTTTFFGAMAMDSWISFVPWGPGSDTGHTMLWSGSNTGTGWFDATTGLRINAGEWTHVAFTVRLGQVEVYLNGENRFSSGGFPNVFTGEGAVFALGVNYWDSPYVGLMDELRIYRHALTPEEVAVLADPETAGSLPDPSSSSSSTDSSSSSSAASSSTSSSGSSSSGSMGGTGLLLLICWSLLRRRRS